MEAVGIRVRFHHDIISVANISKVRLIYIGEHPHRAQIRNRKGLGLTRLNHLTGLDQALDHLAADRSKHGNKRRTTEPSPGRRDS